MKTPDIEPASPWENGHNGSFNGKLRDEGLTGEIFDTLREAQVLSLRWPQTYNRNSPQGAGVSTSRTWGDPMNFNDYNKSGQS